MHHKFYHPEAPDNESTLGQERQRLEAEKCNGTTCRACQQTVKYRDRDFRAVWAVGLAKVCQERDISVWDHSAMKSKVKRMIGLQWRTSA